MYDNVETKFEMLCISVIYVLSVLSSHVIKFWRQKSIIYNETVNGRQQKLLATLISVYANLIKLLYYMYLFFLTNSHFRVCFTNKQLYTFRCRRYYAYSREYYIFWQYLQCLCWCFYIQLVIFMSHHGVQEIPTQKRSPTIRQQLRRWIIKRPMSICVQ